MNLSSALDSAVAANPDRIFLYTDERRYTYAEVLASVNRLAGALRAEGMGIGDRVVVTFANTPEFVIAYFAILKAGGVVVTNNTMNKRYEVAHVVNNSGAVGYLATRKYAVPLFEAWDDLEHKPFVLISDGAGDRARSWEEVMAVQAEEFETVEKSDADLGVMVYTAAHEGGYARGVMLHHGGLIYNASQAAVEYHLTGESIHIGALPLYHTYGCTDCLLCACIAGCGVSLFPRFVPQEVARRIRKEGCTHFAGVPTMFATFWLLEDVAPEDLASLVHCTTGGMAIPLQVLEGFEAKFGKLIQEGYGLTECSPTVSFMRMDGTVKHGTVGTPMKGVQAEAMDDGGAILPRGTTGEIVVQGPIVCMGYWKDPDFTARNFVWQPLPEEEGPRFPAWEHDGVPMDVSPWIRTGDLGCVDEEGFITLTGLKKRMFLTGGFNIYPEELERLMGFTGMVESVSFEAEMDLLQGHAVRAFVKLKPGVEASEREIRNACGRVMAIYKVPKEFVIMAS